MKKINSVFLFSLTVAGCLIMASCGGKSVSPEDEVRNYSKYFIDKISENKTDSLEDSYPDILKADSIVPIESDSILVVEKTPGQYVVTLTEGVTLLVERSKNGDIWVSESKGLFTFPSDKMELAKKTGMWDDNLNDVQLNERMRDEDFFKYLNERSKSLVKSIISVDRKPHITKYADYWYEEWRGYYNLSNNTDYPIKGSDYSVIEKWEWEAQGRYDHGTNYNPGKDIAPHSTIKYPVGGSGRSNSKIVGVKMKIPQEELVARFAPFTGNEYHEYLDSKK